jgi:hypothetical protein
VLSLPVLWAIPRFPKSSLSFGHRPDTNRGGPHLGHRSLESRAGSLAIFLAMSFIERQRFGGSGIARISVAVDIGESLSIREAAV